MKLNYKHLLPADFHAASRVWIYQSNRMFSVSEALQIEDMMKDFIMNWKTHGHDVKGYANMFFGQFIIIIADETNAVVSGCSTDSSVRLIKEIEQKFGVDLFNRKLLAFQKNDKIELLPMQQLNYAVDNGFINGNTIYFNNLVQTKSELEQSWLLPLKDSWLANKLKKMA